jgi:RNA polymerase sigma factor (sigma-70 family)
MKKIHFFLDGKILKRIRENDNTVLGELFIRYERLVISYIQNQGGDLNDAEDMLQEALIVFWQNAIKSDFRLSSKISTYLIGVVKNKWRAELRKRKRFSENGIPEEVPDNNPSSLDKVLKKEQFDLISRALNRISPNCKKLLFLFYFEERNLEDIAKILHLANVDVAKSKKYQCKKSLEEILFKEYSEIKGG